MQEPNASSIFYQVASFLWWQATTSFTRQWHIHKKQIANSSQLRLSTPDTAPQRLLDDRAPRGYRTSLMI